MNYALRLTVSNSNDASVTIVRSQVNEVRATRNAAAVAQNDARAAQEAAWATENTARISEIAAKIAENDARAAQTPPLPPLPVPPSLTPLPAWTPVPLVPPIPDNEKYLEDFVKDNIASWDSQESGPSGIARRFARASAATRAQIAALLAAV